MNTRKLFCERQKTKTAKFEQMCAKFEHKKLFLSSWIFSCELETANKKEGRPPSARSGPFGCFCAVC